MKCKGTKGDGTPCGKSALKGKEACKFHGGAASGRPCVHGRRSALIKTFGPRIGELMQDPDFYVFQPDIALFDERLHELLNRVDQDDTPEWRKQVKELADDLDRVVRSGDTRRLVTALTTIWPALYETVVAGASRDEAWANLLANRERRAALATRAVDAETKKEHAVTVRDLVVLMGRMVDEVELEVGKDAAARVSDRFERNIVRVGSGAIRSAASTRH